MITVNQYINRHKHYKVELELLRSIMLSSGMEETIKWGAPVYTVNGKNVAGLGAFKSYVGIWFFQGVFLKDQSKMLVNAQEGKTQAMRQWRFSSLDEIDAKLVREYVQEAIANQKAGKELKPEKKPLVLPDELKNLLSSNAKARSVFESFSLGHKREYADYISEAKRPETRAARIEKITPMILDSVKMSDRYKR